MINPEISSAAPNHTPEEVYSWVRDILSEQEVDSAVANAKRRLQKIREIVRSDEILSDVFTRELSGRAEEVIRSRQMSGLEDINHALASDAYEPITAEMPSGERRAIEGFGFDETGSLQPVISGQIVERDSLSNILFPEIEPRDE